MIRLLDLNRAVKYLLTVRHPPKIWGSPIKKFRGAVLWSITQRFHIKEVILY